MVTVQSPSQTDTTNKVVVGVVGSDAKEYRDDASSSSSSIHNDKAPMQLCLLDAKGNRMHITSVEQFQAASALLHDLEPTYMDTTASEDAMIYHDGHDTDTNNNFSTRTNTTKRAFLDEVKRFELFRSVIQHEDDLLNQRVSWIILAQSFLMAAFISSSSDGSDALKYITAIVGLLTVVVTMPAILAAGRNIELQQQVYFARISSEERCRELHGHGRNILKYSGERNAQSISMKEEQHERKQYGHIFPNMVR